MVCLRCQKTVGKDSGCRKKIISEFEFPWLRSGVTAYNKELKIDGSNPLSVYINFSNKEFQTECKTVGICM